MNIILDLAVKVGGVLALAGGLIGAWLWFPNCEASGLFGGCHNFFGDVPVNSLGQPETTQLLFTGGAAGALIGAVIGLLVAWVWPHTKKDLEIG